MLQSRCCNPDRLNQQPASLRYLERIKRETAVPQYMDDAEEKRLLSQIPKAQPSRFRLKSISSIVDRLIVEKGYAAQQSSELLQEQWRVAVGEELASQSRIGKIQRGILQVYALNTIVLSELEYSKSKALRHLKAALPDFKLKDIRFKITS